MLLPAVRAEILYGPVPAGFSRSHFAPVGSSAVTWGATAFLSTTLVKNWEKIAIMVGVTGMGLPAGSLNSIFTVAGSTTLICSGFCNPFAARSPAPGVAQMRARLHWT